MSKTNFEVIYETLESMYWRNETDAEILPVFYLTISLNFEIYFLQFPWESAFGVIS